MSNLGFAAQSYIFIYSLKIILIFFGGYGHTVMLNEVVWYNQKVHLLITVKLTLA